MYSACTAEDRTAKCTANNKKIQSTAEVVCQSWGRVWERVGGKKWGLANRARLLVGGRINLGSFSSVTAKGTAVSQLTCCCKQTGASGSITIRELMMRIFLGGYQLRHRKK